ncbi:zinc finger protein 436-like [Leptopilina boulardi]|uniref:zinc finger protein 436-like n=1 Tax=Leptopilina boulardi TaxID=63433 RepID=UPI0021F53456|nr:zinc finger protein 436-like [Leptopilina boulardi]
MEVVDTRKTSANKTQQGNLKLFACPICVERFTSEKQYYGHLRIHTGEVLLSCEQCPESDIKFDSQGKLQMHENLCHNIVRPFKCHECGLLFDRASQLEYHQRSVHLGEKSHICQICEKGFFRKTDLRTHLNIHLGTNVSMCEICGRKFNHVSNLIRHSRTHAGIKPYPCTVCGKRFTQISSLARHKRIHERVQKGKNVNSQEIINTNDYNIKDHVLEVKEITKDVGTSERKVIKRRHYCKICGESFQFAVLLRKHEKEHLNSANIFECKSCHKKFQNPEDIKEHSCRQEAFTWTADDNTSTSENISKHVSQHIDNVDVECHSIFSKDLLPEVSANEQSAETVLYFKAKQMTNINLDEFEEASSHFFRDNVMELANISDLLSICNNENDDLEKEVNHLNTYTGVNDILPDVPRLLETEISSEDQVDMRNFISRKQSSKENIKYRQDNNFKENLLEFEENNTNQYFLNTESQDSTTDLELESVDPKEILTDNEPTLRLVQIETGEQFYELVMDNITDKTQFQDLTQLENVEETGNESVDNLQSFEFFRTEAQTNFEVYTEGVFEDFDRRNYETCAKEFLELVQSEKQKEGETICHAENGDQFLDLIENQNFSEITNKEKEIDSDIPLRDDSSSIVKVVEEFETNYSISQTADPKEIIKPLNKNDSSSTKEKNNKEFHCYVCEKTLSSKYNFTQHMGIHYANHQRFHCKECDISFAWKSTLNKHNDSIHRPEGRQSYVCNICPKVYNNLSQVNEHIKRDHLKERKHICPLCGKSFFKKFDLKSHFRTHTNEKPYQCSFCDKRFHYQSHVIRHERIHSGDKPYNCDVCQRSFCQRSSLKTHKEKHRINKDSKKNENDKNDPE